MRRARLVMREPVPKLMFTVNFAVFE